MEINFKENNYELIKKIKEALKNKEPEIKLKYVHWAILEEIFKELGFRIEHGDWNGWQHDHWGEIWLQGSDYYYSFSCSWYYSSTTFTLVTDPEKVKQLDKNYYA